VNSTVGGRSSLSIFSLSFHSRVFKTSLKATLKKVKEAMKKKRKNVKSLTHFNSPLEGKKTKEEKSSSDKKPSRFVYLTFVLKLVFFNVIDLQTHRK
jgi:hypothetical protein